MRPDLESIERRWRAWVERHEVGIWLGEPVTVPGHLASEMEVVVEYALHLERRDFWRRSNEAFKRLTPYWVAYARGKMTSDEHREFVWR